MNISYIIIRLHNIVRCIIMLFSQLYVIILYMYEYAIIGQGAKKAECEKLF